MNIDTVIESLLFVSGDGLALSHIAEIMEISEDEARLSVDKLKAFYKENKRVNKHRKDVQQKIVNNEFAKKLANKYKDNKVNNH